MVDSPISEMNRQKEKKEEHFQTVRNDLLQAVQVIFQSTFLIEINKKKLLTGDQVRDIDSALKFISSSINNKFQNSDSQWIIDIIRPYILDLKRNIENLERAFEENEKDPTVTYIRGYSEKISFENYVNQIYLDVLRVFNTIDYLDGLYQKLKEQSQKVALNQNSSFLEKLEGAKQDLNKEIDDFRRNRNIADNAKTEDIYHNAVQKYRNLENDYRWYFYWAIGLTVTISLGTFFVKKLLVPDVLGDVEFWVFKASIILVGITLITYFLKQSTHYQRLADQNYQTQVELQAYPSFMESIPTEEAASVRKELALKYFGREIDGAVHKDMSNLISDQMKSTTEMVKAATDVLKVKDKP